MLYYLFQYLHELHVPGSGMGVTVHLGPVTGQPLPIISRGGTSILVTSVYFGIILSITRYYKKGKQKEPESADSQTVANETAS